MIVADFPDEHRSSKRLSFGTPREIITAYSIEAVRGAVGVVEQRARAGSFAVGFVSYDAAAAFDRGLRTVGGSSLPLVWFGIYDGPESNPDDRALPAFDVRRWKSHVARSEYEGRVEAIKRGIRAGDFYQVNHTIRLRTDAMDDPRACYEALRSAQPMSYGMFIDAGSFQILSVSPELFFSRTGRTIETRPMKGTARRGRWPVEDRAVLAALRASEKERAENVMIVDLVRNDLGRIADVGTVAVPRLFDVERHPTVWQMTSTVKAQLRDDVHLPEIFDALFPAGSVVGAPKIAAANWIADNELAPRGVYCGAIGIVRPGGDCVFSVAIRTMVNDRAAGVAEYGTGGGVTIDSTPSGEYDELLAKAAVLAGPAPDFELLETMRLSEGEYVRRDRHVARMRASAEYFDFVDPARSIDQALDACAGERPTGEYRVRLLLTRAASARAEAAPIEPLNATTRAAISCAVAALPVSSDDVFLFHKTTRRGVYEERRAAHPGVDEIILINERGELTECSIGNLVVEISGKKLTPPIECGLLAGTYRDELVESGAVEERILLKSDLNADRRVWRVNSLREWVELTVTRS